MADPSNVEQALDSVGDAVENAVPDPQEAASGLAPTSTVSNNLPSDSKSGGKSQPTQECPTLRGRNMHSRSSLLLTCTYRATS